MKKLRQKLLRLRLILDKKAQVRHAELEEKQAMKEIALKAQLHHEREKEVLNFVREKDEAHVGHKTRVVVDSSNVKRIGDKVILTRLPIPVDVPCAPRDVVMAGAIRVEEADVSVDQFRNLLDERHAIIEETTRHEYQAKTRPVPPTEMLLVRENTKIAPADALHFMATGKIPVRTRAELRDIVELGIEEVEVNGDDATALLYFSNPYRRG